MPANPLCPARSEQRSAGWQQRRVGSFFLSPFDAMVSEFLAKVDRALVVTASAPVADTVPNRSFQ